MQAGCAAIEQGSAKLGCDVDADAALERLTRRHMASWGLDRAAATARVQADDRLNAQIVAASRHRADVLLPARCAGL